MSAHEPMTRRRVPYTPAPPAPEPAPEPDPAPEPAPGKKPKE